MCGDSHKKIDSAANKKRKRIVRGDGGDSNKAQQLVYRIETEIGSTWLFNYYFFLHNYGREPIDFKDFFTGLDSLSIILEIQGPNL